MQLSKLGPYELGKTIGKGGMGSVYSATDTNTGAVVAIKALNPQLAQAEGFRERFEAEIESLKKLRHDGIVRLYGYGEQDGVLFYSMELVEGASLEEEMKAGRRFDWREVANIAIQLCHALKHAHDHGVVHRDIKPANILINSENKVKLADFGIARLFGSTQLTTAGGVLGTADYMSPEQAEGRPVTDRCDQYSLGGVMYALLAGRTPFRSKSLPEMLQLQRYAKPEPVRRYARDTPAQMEEAIAQLLSKEPQQRFPNVKVLSWHLEAMVRALSRPAHDDFAVQEKGFSSNPRLADQGDHLLSATISDGNVSDGNASDGNASDGNVDMPNGTSALSPGALSPGNRPIDAINKAVLSDSDVPPDAMTINAGEQEVEPESGPAQPASSSFTMVDATGENEELHSWKILLAQGAGVLVLLATLAAAVLHFTRPQSADSLYATILAESTSKQTGDLRELEDEVEQFLTRFPEDSRVEKVEEIGSRVLQAKLEHSLEAKARLGHNPDDDLLPIEHYYLSAESLAEHDIQQAADLLESLVILYGLGDAKLGEDETERRRIACLNVARKRLEELRGKVAEMAGQQLPQLKERLQAANQLADTEPEEATKIYRAIVRLFGDQKWASEVVDQAREKLDTL